LVFLSLCPQRVGHVAIKKMLNPVTLELLCLVELPGAERQRTALRASLQHWLEHWCDIQSKHPDVLVAVWQAFWDASPGYSMGILCEYMPLGSLDALIRACGGLPEEAIREIAVSVLQALHARLSANPIVVHGCLKPSQVLFAANGRPRLNFGLEQRLRGCQVFALHHELGHLQAESSTGSMAASPHEQSPAVDIFDLGLLLLVTALGSEDVLRDAIPYARELAATQRGPISQDTCSFLRHELHGEAEPSPGAVPGEIPSGMDMGFLPPASDLLFNRQYSRPFLAFVSTCLEAHTHAAPVTAGDLLQHEFLTGPSAAGPQVYLHEMQRLATLMNEAPDHDPSRFGPAKTRSLMAGVAPSVTRSAQLYLMNIAQSIAPHHGASAASHPRRSQHWDLLLMDSARSLGLSTGAVQTALEAQLDAILQPGQSHRREPH
jgi:serine/threonine protein kinase